MSFRWCGVSNDVAVCRWARSRSDGLVVRGVGVQGGADAQSYGVRHCVNRQDEYARTAPVDGFQTMYPCWKFWRMPTLTV